MWEYDYLFKQELWKNSQPHVWIPRQISREKPILHESRGYLSLCDSTLNTSDREFTFSYAMLLKISLLYVFQLKGKPNLEHLPIIQLRRRPSARRKSTRDVFYFSPKQKQKSTKEFILAKVFMGSFSLFSPEILVRKEHLSGIGKLKIILKFKLILL